MAPKKVLLIGAAGQRGQQFFSKFRADKGFTISGFVLRKTISQNILDFAKEGQIYFDKLNDKYQGMQDAFHYAVLSKKEWKKSF